MSQKQDYMNKNKNLFAEYEEQLKNGTARQITHYTDEQLKELFDKEAAAQKNPNYIPNPLLSMIKTGLIKNIPPNQFQEIIPKEILDQWLKGVEEQSMLARDIDKYRKLDPKRNGKKFFLSFLKQKQLSLLA